MNWRDLGPEERCVMVNAMDGGGLTGLLNHWDGDWTEADLPDLRERLGRAVLRLVERGVVEAYLSDAPLDASP
jgi:hypothetical protein